MKNLIKIFTVLILTVPLVFMGCQKSEINDSKSADPVVTGSDNLKSGIVYCGTPTTAVLTDIDEEIIAGTVTVGNDETTLYVTFEAADDWVFTGTYLYVGSELNLLPGVIYGDGTGDFNASLFPYKKWHFGGVQSYTFDNINLNGLDDCFIVVACSDVKNTTGEEYIVWGKSLLKCSGYYFEYCKQDCPLGACETAFAYGGDIANCFLGIKKDGTLNPNGPPSQNFNRWGWTNGAIGSGTYDMEIWAAAGQCDHTNGTLVGSLTVVYDEPAGAATITYLMDAGFSMEETHLYVGSEILPRKKYPNGKFTVAPGKYPYNDGDAISWTEGEVIYEINDLPGGPIYVIGHTVVCGEFE